MAEHLPSMNRTLGSIPSMAKTTKKQTKPQTFKGNEVHTFAHIECLSPKKLSRFLLQLIMTGIIIGIGRQVRISLPLYSINKRRKIPRALLGIPHHSIWKTFPMNRFLYPPFLPREPMMSKGVRKSDSCPV